ncbi:MAG: CehA/McbA family metallohydrolase [Myxococcota bacterium]
MKNPVHAAALCGLLTFGLTSCDTQREGYARARRIVELDEVVGGPKGLANVGDFVLENDRIRVAVLASVNPDGSERHSPGPGTFGGGLVDADLNLPVPSRQGGRGSDQFAELMPTANMNVILTAGEDAVRIVNDGANGEPAVIRVQGESEPFITLLGALWALTRAPDFHITTDYILEPGKSWVTIRSVFEYGDQAPSADPQVQDMGYFEGGLPLLTWAIESGVVGGDFYLSGGSVDVFAPGIGFDEDGAVFRANARGDNTFQVPFEFPFVAGVADGVSYGIASREGNVYVPLFTASQTVVVGAGRDGEVEQGRFPDGTALAYERYFFIGHGDIGSIYDQYLEARGLPYGELRGTVLEANTGDPVSGANVFVYEPGGEYPIDQIATDIHPLDDSPDGSFAGRLPPGTWELVVHQDGRPIGERVTVEIAEGEATAVALEAGQTGALTFTIRDETGRPVPAKLTLVREDGPAERDPSLGDGFIGGSPQAVVFAMYGDGVVELPPGEYRAIASRGIEYEIDVSEPFRIGATQGAAVELQVERSVVTDGWVSADLHVHGIASHDSGVSEVDRVRTMVCEGVEFFASTDHDFIVDYAPTVEALGLSEWVQTAVGLETTTIEIGHFLSFPLEIDHLAEAGGAMDWTGAEPDEILQSLEARGQAAGFDPVTFVGHPRDGILGYFDQYGFNPYAGTPGRAGNPGNPLVEQPTLSLTNPLLTSSKISWNFDALEMLNGKRFELIRTPTAPELEGFALGTGVDVYDMMTRTMQEQEDLQNGVYRLGAGIEGHIDDWFTLLNLGYRFTVLGNSDTHGWTGVESGCPRNFVMAETDDPAFLDDQAIADAVKEHRVIASYGPFVRLWANGEPIGSEIVTTGEVQLEIDVQAPTWMGVDRVELYENGTLIREWSVEDAPVVERFQATHTVTPAQDSWYVVAVAADDDMQPVFTPVEMPYIELQTVVTEALGGISAVSSLISPATPIPRTFPVLPYAITNPIWVDRDGDGFDAPGVPGWLVAPE